MNWKPLREAHEITGLSKDTIYARARRDTSLRKRNAEGSGWLYDVAGLSKDEEDRERSASGPIFQTPIKEPKPPPYYYDEARRRYIFNLPSKPRHPWVVSAEDVELLVSAYSNDGDGATINQVARKLGWHRKTVMETLKQLGKTHDSLPFTDEQIAKDEEDSLAEDLVRRKEEKVWIRAERASWKQVKIVYERAKQWERFITDTMSQLDVPPPPKMPSWKKRNKPKKIDNLYAVSHATDLHYGSSGWKDQVGEEFSREVCRDRLLNTTENLIEKIDRWGRPTEVVIGTGADWFHVDNHRGTTTKGTPQDMDGNFLQIFEGGASLARDQIEMWRQYVRKVHVIGVRGNHDYYTTALLMCWLQAYYRNEPDVVIDRPEPDRVYKRLGSTLLGLTHGHGVADKDLVSLMAAEEPKLWGDTSYRMWLTGHWHTQICYEKHGVTIEHEPSLAGTDRWHNEHGYVGNRRALVGRLVDPIEGPFAKLLSEAKK